MTNKKSSNKSGKQQTRIGTLVVTLLIVGAYWWTTGSLPGNESTPANKPVVDAPAVNAPANATNTPVEVAAVEEDAEEVEEEAATEEAAEEVTEAAIAAEVVEEEAATAEATAAVIEEEVAEAVATAEGETVEAATEVPTATAIPTEPPPTATTPPKPTATPANPPRAGPRGMPVVNYDELPREALETIILIAEGGPFPFDRDGITFQNREGLLPNHPRGYYSEYTVITPGSRTRGARRIVVGEENEIYYTDDHYDSFSWVVLP